jgi:hypothetical protein
MKHVFFQPETHFLITQHRPNKGEHRIRYYGWHLNKSRGLREKGKKFVALPGKPEPDTAFRRKCRLSGRRPQTRRLCLQKYWRSIIDYMSGPAPEKFPGFTLLDQKP